MDARQDSVPEVDAEDSGPMTLRQEVVTTASERDALLYELDGREWRALCVVPCRAKVLVGSTLAIGGSGFDMSRGFAVRWSPRPLEVRGNMGSSVARDGGYALIAIGSVGMVVGFGVGLSSMCLFCDAAEKAEAESRETAGLVLIGVGAGLILTGTVLVVANVTRLKFGEQIRGHGATRSAIRVGAGLELTAEGLRF
jgi:hypothetical protein